MIDHRNEFGFPATETNVAAIPGLSELWSETLGDSRIMVALLDGPVEREHPSLADAKLHSLGFNQILSGPATAHGTHVASVIFGQHSGQHSESVIGAESARRAESVQGIAPLCRGVIIPVYRDSEGGQLFHAPKSNWPERSPRRLNSPNRKESMRWSSISVGAN